MISVQILEGLVHFEKKFIIYVIIDLKQLRG